MVLLIAGFGMFRLGIVPHGPEIPRLIAWVFATFLYVALWLSFGLLLSVVIHRAATSALVGFGVWLLLTIFGQLIVTLVSGLFTPASNATVEQQLGSVQAQEWVARILPGTLYQEITTVILHPNVSQISTPATVGQLVQSQYQIPPQYQPGCLLARPEPAPRVAAAHGAGGTDGGLLRGRVRPVHAPGSPRLTAIRRIGWSRSLAARMLRHAGTGERPVDLTAREGGRWIKAEAPAPRHRAPGDTETPPPAAPAPTTAWAPPPPVVQAGPAGFVYADVPNRAIAYIIDAIVIGHHQHHRGRSVLAAVGLSVLSGLTYNFASSAPHLRGHRADHQRRRTSSTRGPRCAARSA